MIEITCEEKPEIIPTASEWGLIILMLILMIFGIVTIQQREISYAMPDNQSHLKI